MMQEFKILFLNTIQKELRSKTLYILFGFTVLLIILLNLFVNYIYTNVLDANTSSFIGDKTATIVYITIDFWSTFLCILFGVNTVKSDISSNTIGQLLSFPIQRRSYLMARILGSTTIIFSYYVLSLLLAVVLFSVTSNKMIGGIEMVYALVPSLLNIFIQILIAVNLSFFLPRMMAFVSMSFLTFFIVLSNKAFLAQGTGEYFTNLGVVKSIGLVFHMIFPRIGVVSEWIGKILHSSDIQFNYPVEISHLVIVLGLWILVTVKLFKKEDF